VGFFNESLVRNQDNEFNSRLIKAGGKILLHPDIKSSYYARPDLISLGRQHFMNGFWCMYGMKFSKRPFFLRHLIPMGFVFFLILSLFLGLWLKIFLWIGIFVLGLYFVGAFMASILISLRTGANYFPYFLVVFPVLHFPYGIGSLAGFWKFKTEK
jgi:hypothetical protein